MYCIGLAPEFNWWIPLSRHWALGPLQILSNFANDYGDGVMSNNVDRIGPMRAIQSGIASSSANESHNNDLHSYIYMRHSPIYGA
jgi:1,4-dihydroxy-2-naphthoate octaprenyltransferase